MKGIILLFVEVILVVTHTLTHVKVQFHWREERKFNIPICNFRRSRQLYGLLERMAFNEKGNQMQSKKNSCSTGNLYINF